MKIYTPTEIYNLLEDEPRQIRWKRFVLKEDFEVLAAQKRKLEADLLMFTPLKERLNEIIKNKLGYDAEERSLAQELLNILPKEGE